MSFVLLFYSRYSSLSCNTHQWIRHMQMLYWTDQTFMKFHSHKRFYINFIKKNHDGCFFISKKLYKKDVQNIPKGLLKKTISMFSSLSSVSYDKKDNVFSPILRKIALWVASTLESYSLRSLGIRNTKMLYKHCTEQGIYDLDRNFWYSKHALPPSFQTWFHITLLHVWMLMVRIRAFPEKICKIYQQELVNHFFEDCEYKMINEYKIHNERIISFYMKDLLMQFNGSVFAYDEGMYRNDCVLALALWRNLYAGKTKINVSFLAASVLYVRNTLFELDNMLDEDVQNANIRFLRISDTFELKD
ncbi:hypothetical protein T552_01189 [Pneumocystis carinii B80]|uniref:Ubiquinol-cytochrome c chaperone domain-containing protein n=1 Tax=Pneumocystis carinii (strain B80) TaxID=1408658 RepID=A0A0W4ZLI8_PNEC8|nr:hypothetical protein T552_01189 [Pneumocystis carinii B80]KTW29233.1 hypothetical protein T552_01189 [Pneumocystis carinii B80]